MSRPQNPIVRLLEFAGPHKRLTIAGCALSALNAVLAIAMLVCVWFVVRDLVAVAPAWGEARQAPVYGAWALAFALAGLVVYFAALMCTHLAAFRTATNMRKAALEHLAKVPLGYFSVRSTGELRRVIEGSTGLTEGVLAHRIPDFVGALVTPVAYLVVMFVFDWVMGLVCLIPVLASAFCMFLMMGGGLGGKDGEGNSNAMQFMVNYQNALDKMNKAAVEYVRGIPVVKVFQQTVHSFRAFRESIVAYCDFATAYVKLCEGPQVAQLVAINATFFVLVPAGILLAGAAGDFGAFLTNFLFYVIFSALTTMMMSKIMYSSQAVTEAQDAVSRIDGILSAPLMAEVDPARAEAPADDAIDFDHVTFSYPGADAPALEDVVLHVPSGATVALVGPSGGGKTTAASLVPRFWDASAGRVLVGGDRRAVHPAGRAHGARGLRVPERQAVQAEPAGQHPRRAAGGDARGGGGGRARGAVRRHRGEAAAGARHRGGRPRRVPLGRRVPAHRARARHPEGRAHRGARRGHGLRRPRERGAHPARAGGAVRRARPCS